MLTQDSRIQPALPRVPKEFCKRLTREGHPMAEPRMTKTALFTHFAERFGIKARGGA